MRTRETAWRPRDGGPGVHDEGGFVIVPTLVIMFLVTSLAAAALLYSQMDMAVAGNYRVEKTSEIAADGGLELIKAMIYSNDALLNLPLAINASWSGAHVAYHDIDIDITMDIAYKVEDNINYNTTESYLDEFVRYGKDYNYLQAQKDVGKQPVYTVTFQDNLTGAKGQADLISALGFKTPAAIFSRGTIRMNKWGLASEEKQEVTSGAGFPAIGTTLSKSDANVFIQRVRSKSSPNMYDLGHTGAAGSCVTHYRYQDQTGSYYYYDRYDRLYSQNTAATHQTHAAAYKLINPHEYLWPDDIFTDNGSGNESDAAYAAGRRNEGRDKQFILVGVGDRTADLDAAPSDTAAKAIFNFNKDDANVIKYNYVMPAPGSGTCPADWTAIECAMGAKFSDFREVADFVFTGNSTITVPNDTGGTYITTGGMDMSGRTFGTQSSPQLIYFNSNMDDAGGSNGHDPIALVTSGGSQMQGYGVLVINGDAEIFGSINWKGLMLVRGNLTFRMWQGGDWCTRSDASLASNWAGFIIVGGNMNLATLAGGTILLGYGGPGSDASTIKGIIAGAIPHKVLAWRRSYE